MHIIGATIDGDNLSPTVKKAAEKILQLIVTDDYQVGRKLPGEIELSVYCGTGRNTVRSAIRVLNDAGIVNTIKTKGSFLSEVPPRPDSPIQNLEYYSDNFAQILDNYEVRRMLESKSAELACQRATDEEVALICKYCKECEVQLQCGHYSNPVDIEFHLQIARSAHNKELLSLVRKSYIGISRYFELMESEAYQPKMIIRAHNRIADAIQRRDEATATKAMSDHIDAALLLLRKWLNI